MSRIHAELPQVHVLALTVNEEEEYVRCRLMEKLGVHNTAELVRYAARRGLLP